MFKYVEVKNGVVVGSQSSTNKVNNPDLMLIHGDLPEDGSTYLEGVFTAPVKATPVVAKVRIITVRALKQRFYIAERHAVRNTTNIYVEDIYDDLVGSAYVNLDDDKVAQGLGVVLNNLTTIDNIQDPSIKTVLNEVNRLAELLVDGREDEQYNGVL